jgi:hypothetical protein
MRAVFSAGLILIAVAAVLAFSACKDDKKTPPPAAGETPSGEASPADGGFSLPESGVSALLSTPYANDADLNPLTPSPEQLPFPEGSVSAHWYQSDGLYVVWFKDFPLDEGLCPGTSILLASGGFQNPANSPTAEGACEGVDTLKPPPTGPHICGEGLMLFQTEVPVETEGELYASTNRQHEDGSSTGVLGHAPANLAETPEVDLSSCEGPTG